MRADQNEPENRAPATLRARFQYYPLATKKAVTRGFARESCQALSSPAGDIRYEKPRQGAPAPSAPFYLRIGVRAAGLGHY